MAVAPGVLGWTTWPAGGPGMGGVVGVACCCCWFPPVLPAAERLASELPGVSGVWRRGDGVEGVRLVNDGSSYKI